MIDPSDKTQAQPTPYHVVACPEPMHVMFLPVTVTGNCSIKQWTQVTKLRPTPPCTISRRGTARAHARAHPTSHDITSWHGPSHARHVISVIARSNHDLSNCSIKWQNQVAKLRPTLRHSSAHAPMWHIFRPSQLHIRCTHRLPL